MAAPSLARFLISGKLGHLRASIYTKLLHETMRGKHQVGWLVYVELLALRRPLKLLLTQGQGNTSFSI